ncbi:hypothetical protein HDV00_000866 [Rhizophlyctis rosea]|nr:hypothetical protein HDV00_000866 [Rhizophlyctis rosea]
MIPRPLQTTLDNPTDSTTALAAQLLSLRTELQLAKTQSEKTKVDQELARMKEEMEAEVARRMLAEMETLKKEVKEKSDEITSKQSIISQRDTELVNVRGDLRRARRKVRKAEAVLTVRYRLERVPTKEKCMGSSYRECLQELTRKKKFENKLWDHCKQYVDDKYPGLPSTERHSRCKRLWNDGLDNSPGVYDTISDVYHYFTSPPQIYDIAVGVANDIYCKTVFEWENSGPHDETWELGLLSHAL